MARFCFRWESGDSIDYLSVIYFIFRIGPEAGVGVGAGAGVGVGVRVGAGVGVDQESGVGAVVGVGTAPQ